MEEEVAVDVGQELHPIIQYMFIIFILIGGGRIS